MELGKSILWEQAQKVEAQQLVFKGGLRQIIPASRIVNMQSTFFIYDFVPKGAQMGGQSFDCQ